MTQLYQTKWKISLILKGLNSMRIYGLTYRSRNCATKTRFVRISNALYARTIKIALKTNANQRISTQC